MRACRAILKDSFREALASRVMLVTLIGILVVLALVAPFGLDVTTSTELRSAELVNPERLLTRLQDEHDQTDTAIAHLWSLLSKDQREQFQAYIQPDEDSDSPRSPHDGPDRIRRRVTRQLNRLLEQPDFFQAGLWPAETLDDETTQLLQRSNPDEDETQRRNLLLLAATFPRAISLQDSHAFSLTYGTAIVQGPLPLTPAQFEPLFDQILLGVVGTFLGFFGVFGCLLVTAGVIPRTFEPGEISLLLSKPVRRSVLFVVKFLGGCVFTLLYASVLVVGIWFLLGVRMDYWRHNLLWCIPVYVLLFMIYYSVSAVAGAIWRNSIVALSLVVVFWLLVTVVGVTKEALRMNLIEQDGLQELVAAGDQVLAINGRQQTFVWKDGDWKEVFRETGNRMRAFERMLFGGRQRFAPVYDPHGRRILALERVRSRFGGTGSSELVAGLQDDQWDRVKLGQVADDVETVLLTRSGRLLLPGRKAIYEFKGQTEKQRQQAEFLGRISGGLLGQNHKAFEPVPSLDLPERDGFFNVCMDPSTDDLWIFANQQLQHLTAQDDGTWISGNTCPVETDGPIALTVAGDRVLLGLMDGQLRVLNTTDLTEVTTYQLPEQDHGWRAVASPDEQTIAVYTEQAAVLLFDRQTDTFRTWTAPGQSVTSAITFSPNGELLAADGRLAVRRFSVQAGVEQPSEEFSGTTSWVYDLYDYVLRPVWTVLPKPADLDQCVQYLLAKDEASLLPGERRLQELMNPNEEFQSPDFDVWSVFRDNTLFVLAMLSIGCLYISRRDF